MRLGISTTTRFWLLDLAREMKRHGCLERLYTALPASRVEEVLRPHARTYPALLGLAYMARKVGPAAPALFDELNWLLLEGLDRLVARTLGDLDVIVALSGCGLHTFRRAKRLGIRTVCERGSSHIVWQDGILEQEYRKWGVPYRRIDPRIREKELQEYDLCDLIAVPSSFVRRTFVEKGVSAEKVEVRPFGVNFSMFRPQPKQDGVFRVLFVGTVSLRKGIPYLFEAVSDLRLPDFELCIAGPISPEAKPLLDRHRDSFRYLGVLPMARLSEVYSQASVFIIPSIEEGLAMVQGQALACGLPIIATPNTGAEDLFTDGVEGRIVPACSAEALRRAIIELYESPARREAMSEAALRRVAGFGGWDSYGEQAVRSCRRLIGAAAAA